MFILRLFSGFRELDSVMAPSYRVGIVNAQVEIPFSGYVIHREESEQRIADGG